MLERVIGLNQVRGVQGIRTVLKRTLRDSAKVYESPSWLLSSLMLLFAPASLQSWTLNLCNLNSEPYTKP